MKSKKRILSIIIFFTILLILNVKSNASCEVNSQEELVNLFGEENVQVVNDAIVLKNDIILEDTLQINDGNYFIDLNGKTISVSRKGFIDTIHVHGGNVTIEDSSSNNGKIISERFELYCDKGFLRLLGGTIDSKYGEGIYVSEDGIVQVDGGIVKRACSWNGSIIVNGGTFNSLVVTVDHYMANDPIPEEKKSKVRINGGTFLKGITLWGENIEEYVKIKGGEFKSADDGSDGVFYSHSGDYTYDLNKLLEKGYKFEKNNQITETISWDDGSIWYTEFKMKDNKVIKENDSTMNKNTVFFVNHEGNLLKKEKVFDGKSATPPEEPQKEGYAFIGWYGDFNNVNKDLVITPKYEKIHEFTVDNVKQFDRYTGKEIELNILVRDEITNEILQKGIDYEMAYTDNVNAGKCIITIKGLNKYQYAKIKKAVLEILPNPLATSNTKLEFEKDFVYTGSKIEPKVKVTYKNIVLEEGKDYEASYRKNINAGAAEITIKGIGNYRDQVFGMFKILPKELKEDGIIVDLSDRVYNGTQINPEVIVKDDNKVLTKGIDYDVYYNNTHTVGTAKITVVGKGNYSGEFTKTFNIIKQEQNINKPTQTAKNPLKKLSIKSLKNTILRCVTMTWNKDSKAKGYEIYRATNKNGSYSLVKKISSNSITMTTFVAQKKGTYYYKIRSYTVINGQKVYSEFSNIQTVTVKR